MTSNREENDFTQILTTTPDVLNPGIKRQESWLKRVSFIRGPEDLIDCQSCKGTGLREFSTELVALIPYNDERLKPRRTKCKILLALVICSVLVALCTFIFLPGHVEVHSAHLNLTTGYIPNPKEVFVTGEHDLDNRTHLAVNVNVTIGNHNRFLPIKINNVAIILKAQNHELTAVGDETFKKVGTVAPNNNFTKTFSLHTNGYNAIVLNCKCCTNYASYDDLCMQVGVTIQYGLTLFGVQYFSSFVSNEKWWCDDCNYFDNINVGGPQNITCETYNTCIRDGSGYYGG